MRIIKKSRKDLEYYHSLMFRENCDHALLIRFFDLNYGECFHYVFHTRYYINSK